MTSELLFSMEQVAALISQPAILQNDA